MRRRFCIPRCGGGVAEIGYLVGIGAVAIGIGALAIIYAPGREQCGYGHGR